MSAYRGDNGDVARTVSCPRCKAPVTVPPGDDTIACGTCDGRFVLEQEGEQRALAPVPSSSLARRDQTLIVAGTLVAAGALVAVLYPPVGKVVLGVCIAVAVLMRFAVRRGREG